MFCAFYKKTVDLNKTKQNIVQGEKKAFEYKTPLTNSGYTKKR